MSAVQPARPLEVEGASLTQQHQHQHNQHHTQQHNQPLSSDPASPPPPLPSRNLRRTSRFLDVLLDTTKSSSTVDTAALATAAAHDVYMSSEEDASSFSSDMSDYNTDEEMEDDNENDACSSSTSTDTTTPTPNSSCDGGASLRTSPSSSSTQQDTTAAPSSPPSAARRRSRDATARAVSVVYAGKPSLVDLVLERETRRRSVPSLRAEAAAAASATSSRNGGSGKDTTRSLRIITEDLPSRLSTASPICRPASASPYVASTMATTPTLTPRSSLLFRGVSRTLTLSRRLGRSARRDESRGDRQDEPATPLTASASATLPPHRVTTPLSAMFSSTPFPTSPEEEKRQRRTDAYTVTEISSSGNSSDTSRPSSAYIRSIPRSQTASILATPGALASRKENADGGGRFFSGRRRSLKLL